MAASETNSGASPLVWALIGVVLGLIVGWWYQAYLTYVIILGFAGWMVGLTLRHSGGDAEHH